MVRLKTKNNYGQPTDICGEARYIGDKYYIVFYMNSLKRPFVVKIDDIINIEPVDASKI